jgi:hypothetical protein
MGSEDCCAILWCTILVLYIISGLIIFPISSLILYEQTPIQKYPLGLVYFNKSWPVSRHYGGDGPYMDITVKASFYSTPDILFNTTVRYPTPPQTIFKKTTADIEKQYESFLKSGTHNAYIKQNGISYTNIIKLDGWIAAEVIYGIGAGVGAILLLFFGIWGLYECCKCMCKRNQINVV